MNESIYSLLGCAIGGTICIYNTWLTNKANLRLEKLKIYEGGRIEAYKNLFRFSDVLFGDQTDEMSSGFLDTMRDSFYKEIFPNYLYYPKNIRELLTELKNLYDSWGHADCFDQEHAENFLSQRLNSIAKELQKLSIKEANLCDGR